MMDWRKLLQKPWALAVGVVTAGGLAVALWAKTSWVILLLILISIAIGFLLFRLYRNWRERRQSAQFRAGLNQNASKAPANVNDPGKLAEVDQLRRKFDDGFRRVIEEGRRKGMDYLYRHP